MSAKPPAKGAAGTARCPICGKPADPAHRPFCSKRCADVDLHRWFSGSYAVPAEEHEARPGDEPSEDERA
jgi:endogenous inhibitor of DNA gyrase (YacG/DUF329 family)